MAIYVVDKNGNEIKIAGGGGGINFTPGESLTLDENILNVTIPTRGIYTQEEFDALSEEQKTKGFYVIDDGQQEEDDSESGSKLPEGGTAGQVLVKKSEENQDAEWKTLTANDVGAITGTGISTVQGITQDEFDALTTKDPNTLYVITEE